MAKLITKHISELEHSVYSQLYSLNFRSLGLMRSLLVKSKKTNTGWVAYIIDGKKVLGWGIVNKHMNTVNRPFLIMPNTYNAHFYVRRTYRRSGLGSKLYKAIKEISNNKRLRIVKHDVISKQFFKNVGK